MTEPSEGLGDSIKKVTNALGIKQCGGCKKRQEILNRMFPYKSARHKEEHERQLAELKTAQKPPKAPKSSR